MAELSTKISPGSEGSRILILGQVILNTFHTNKNVKYIILLFILVVVIEVWLRHGAFFGVRTNTYGDEDDGNKTQDDLNLYHDTSLILRVRQRRPIATALKGEALAALNLALDMQAQGKTEKAAKLFHHALSLDPSHADILNEFGEFLEKHEDNVVKADHMYNRALMLSPGHSKALANRQRTLKVVKQIDRIHFQYIDKKRDALHRVPANHAGLRRAKREAYFYHVYHSNAIEGNTLTLSQTRSILETRIAIGGKSLVEQNEVLGLDAALTFINSTLLNRVGAITLDDIFQIHRRVLGFVDPPEAGRFRTTQVFVGNFQPPSAEDLLRLMSEFIEWLNSEETLRLHPIEFAALAHYKLVTIHPFVDGNGRTSRLLMNLVLMQAGYPPVTIRVEDRQRYYDTLELANDGDIRPFIRFIAQATEETLDQYLICTIEKPNSSLAGIGTEFSNDRVIIIDTES